MNNLLKSALVLGAVGALALGSMTASEARSGRWVAGAAGFAVGARDRRGSRECAAATTTAATTTAATTPTSRPMPAASYDSYAYSPTYVAPP